KGRPVFIEGRLKLDTWEDKTSGQKRSKMKVVGEQLQLLGSRDGGGGSGGGGAGGGGGEVSEERGTRSAGRPASPPKRPEPDPDLDTPEDDVPF
ncbi:MAG TPA: single-stranded DNA-binding protein, partial [Chthoniobacteraceae bacterium]|nr:single-stranded DNA-binding protein [Chthoniobacteraceae bacterium]